MEQRHFGLDAMGLNGAPAPALYFDMGDVVHADYIPGFTEPETDTPAFSNH